MHIEAGGQREQEGEVVLTPCTLNEKREDHVVGLLGLVDEEPIVWGLGS